jgi:hypothetical protein
MELNSFQKPPTSHNLNSFIYTLPWGYLPYEKLKLVPSTGNRFSRARSAEAERPELKLTIQIQPVSKLRLRETVLVSHTRYHCLILDLIHNLYMTATCNFTHTWSKIPKEQQHLKMLTSDFDKIMLTWSWWELLSVTVFNAQLYDLDCVRSHCCYWMQFID